MNEVNISVKLAELRSAKNVTQEDVALALGVSNKTVSKWENGTSTPDLTMLVALAGYYDVSTDVLLGLKKEHKGTQQVIANEFKGLSRPEVALKIFEIISAMFPASYNAAGFGFDRLSDSLAAIPPQADMPRCQVCLNEIFNFAVRSDDVNFAVIQLQNRSNFSWLLDEQKQGRIVEYLHFLADTDTLKILYFLHSTDCSRNFTAQYMSKNTGVALERVVEILENCCRLDICSKETAHLKNGEVTVYESFGDGLALAIISIAFERMCGRKSYEYSYYSENKMIRGKQV